VNENLKGLVDAVAAWLAFEAACGRQRALAESLLNIPISEFCQSRTWDLHHQRRVFDDERHAQARPQAVDYEIFKGKQSLAHIECKLGYGRPDARRILRDISKLLMLKRRIGGECYLLFAGISPNDLAAEMAKPRAHISRLLVLESKWKRISGSDEHMQRLWAMFCKEKDNVLGDIADRPRWNHFWIRGVHRTQLRLGNTYVFAGLWEVALRPKQNHGSAPGAPISGETVT
jgi:hypothetical protein